MAETPDFSTFSRKEPAPQFTRRLIEVGNDFCARECPVKDTLESQGIVCSFVIRQALRGKPLAGTSAALWEVTENTWFQCVDNMREEGKPIVILSDDQQSFTTLGSYF